MRLSIAGVWVWGSGAVLLAGAGCFQDSGGGSEAADTADTADTAGDGSSGTTSMTADTGASTTEAPTVTSMSAPICGDDKVEPPEECDPGVDPLGCTETCELSSCGDSVANGGETDVDCGGGLCSGCGLCLRCVAPADCDPAFTCLEGRCVRRVDVEYDPVNHCSPDMSKTAELNLGFPGTYLAEAKPSAASLWPDSLISPPTTGWAYYPECKGLKLNAMHTPLAIYYATPEAAIAAMAAQTELVDLGALIACGFTDVECKDNQGTIAFSLTYQCP